MSTELFNLLSLIYLLNLCPLSSFSALKRTLISSEKNIFVNPLFISISFGNGSSDGNNTSIGYLVNSSILSNTCSTVHTVDDINTSLKERVTIFLLNGVNSFRLFSNAS